MPDTSNALLLSYGKSGTLLVRKIVENLQKEFNLFSSVKQETGMSEIIAALCSEFVHGDHVLTADQLVLDRGVVKIAFPHPVLKAIRVGDEILDGSSSLLTSHVLPEDLLSLMPSLEQRKIIYVYRDVRAAIVSWAHYTTKPTLMRRNAYKYSSVERVLRDEKLVREKAQQWANHVKFIGDHLNREILKVRYEDLVTNKKLAISNICEYLALPTDSSVLDKVDKGTDYERMRKDSPEHVRSNGRGRADWSDHLSTRSLEIINEVTAKQLDSLGYR